MNTLIGFIQTLTEKRSNARLNRADKTILEFIIEKYQDNSFNEIYFTFTGVHKLGINPINKYNTPTGIYCYQLSKYIEEIIKEKTFIDVIPYQSEAPFVIFFKCNGPSNILYLNNYTKTDLKSDISTLRLLYEEELIKYRTINSDKLKDKHQEVIDKLVYKLDTIAQAIEIKKQKPIKSSKDYSIAKKIIKNTTDNKYLIHSVFNSHINNLVEQYDIIRNYLVSNKLSLSKININSEIDLAYSFKFTEDYFRLDVRDIIDNNSYNVIIDALLDMYEGYGIYSTIKINFIKENISKFRQMILSLRECVIDNRTFIEHYSSYDLQKITHTINYLNNTYDEIKKVIDTNNTDIINIEFLSSMLNELNDNKRIVEDYFEYMNKNMSLISQPKSNTIKKKSDSESKFNDAHIKNRVDDLINDIKQKIERLQNHDYNSYTPTFDELLTVSTRNVSNNYYIPARCIWYFTNKLSKSLAHNELNLSYHLWRSILHNTLSYTGCVDDGYGIIHPLEKVQSVFFNTTDLTLLEIFDNKENSFKSNKKIVTRDELESYLSISDIEKNFSFNFSMDTIIKYITDNNIDYNLIFNDEHVLYYIIKIVFHHMNSQSRVTLFDYLENSNMILPSSWLYEIKKSSVFKKLILTYQ